MWGLLAVTEKNKGAAGSSDRRSNDATATRQLSRRWVLSKGGGSAEPLRVLSQGPRAPLTPGILALPRRAILALHRRSRREQ